MKRRNGVGETVKRRRGETEKGRNGEKKKLTDSPIPRFAPLEAKGFPSGFSDSKKAGFTILEAMVALVILSLALLALLRVMPVGIKGSKLAEETTIATMLAQKKIEAARASWPPTSVAKTNLGSEGYSNFDYAIAVYDYVSPTTYLQGVTVSIYWPAGKPTAEQRVIDFTTCVADYNP